MAGAQQIMGISSGMDTAGIIEALMNVEKSSTTTRTQTKIDTAKLKLEAYRQTNIMLSSVSTAIKSFGDTSLWAAKSATSSNANALSATANQYAKTGTYSYRVAQLASAAQYSSKGFSSSKTAVSPNKSGYISVDSAKASVDTSASLADLNGGAGVYRGSVRIQDASGQTAVVDLAACMTVNDVVTAINSAGSVSVTASINDEGTGFTIKDNSGGTGNLRVQNYGAGTTATDLGLSASSVADADGNMVIQGGNVWRLGTNTALSALNDGNGVEKGEYRLGLVDNLTGHAVAVDFDLSGANSIGDVIEGINESLKRASAASAENAAAIGDLRVEIAADGRSLQWSGMSATTSYSTIHKDLATGDKEAYLYPQMLDQLGLQLGDISNAITGVTEQKGQVIFGAMDSPMLKTLSGASGGGVGASGTVTGDTTVTLDVDAGTLLKDLNSGQGLSNTRNGGGPVFTFTHHDGQGAEKTYSIDSSTLSAAEWQEWVEFTSSDSATIGDLVTKINDALHAQGLDAGLNFELTDTGVTLTGWDGTGSELSVDGNLARDLGVRQFIFVDNIFAEKPLIDEGADPSTINGATALADLKNKPATEGGTASDVLGTYAVYTDVDPDDADAGQYLSGFSAGAFVVKVGTDGEEFDLLEGLSFAEGDTPTVQDVLDYANQRLHNFLENGDPDLDAGAPTTDYLRVADDGTRLVVDVDALHAYTASDQKDGNIILRGGLASNLGVAGTVRQTPMAGEFLASDIRPSVVGRYVDSAFDSSSTTLSELYLGGKTLDADSAVSVKVGTETFSTTLGDLGLDPATATVDDYVSALNAKLQEWEGEQGATFSMGFEFTTLTNGDGLTTGIGIAMTDGAASLGSAVTIQLPTGTSHTFAAGTTAATANLAMAGDTMAVRSVQTQNPGDQSLFGTINFTIDGGANAGTHSFQIDAATIDENSSLNDLLRELNKQAADAGLDITFRINDAKNGIAVENNTGGKLTFTDSGNVFDTLGADLGLVGKSSYDNGYLNGGDLDRAYITRATALADLNGGTGVPAGKFKITTDSGAYLEVNTQDCKTIGDVVDALNYYSSGLGVSARINDTGDGILLESVVDPANPDRKVGFRIDEVDGGTVAAKLGLLGTSVADGDRQIIDGSFEKTIEVTSEDTLEDIMYRLDASGAAVSTSIIHDGTSSPYRLMVTADSSGALGNFMIDTDIAALGLTQTSAGKDSVLLLGDSTSGTQPIALTSKTNTNSNALLGVTLQLSNVTTDYVSITVSNDTSGIATALESVVTAYNDFVSLYQYLITEDAETGEKGILQGDNELRKLMDQVTNLFYETMNGTNSAGEKKSLTYFDLGISFEALEDDKSYAGKMVFDATALNSLISSDFDWLRDMITGTQNMATAATDAYVYAMMDNDEGYGVENLIDGDTSSTSKGFKASEAIDAANNSNNQVVVQLGGQGQYLSYINIGHWDTTDEASADYALRDFTVEYLDANNEWQVAREVTGNTGSQTLVTLSTNTFAKAIRITASKTNAEDGCFRLSEIEAWGNTGLTGASSRTLTALTDSIDGWYASHSESINNDISSLETRLAQQEERLAIIEERLNRQYTNMEVALGTLQQQSDYVNAQLDALTANSK